MTHERKITPALRRPYEVYGFSEKERLHWRVSQERFEAILQDDLTVIHKAQETSNMFGEFLFVTTSRQIEQGRVAMTFFGYGYHEYRERWITNEWYWYQANTPPDLLRQQIAKDDAVKILEGRLESIQPLMDENTQTERGRLFELLADLTDEDSALAELQDLGDDWARLLGESDAQPEMESPTGKKLLDPESREKLPPLYSGEEQGLDALAKVKFFTPDAQWSWFASEFDGHDILFGLVVGLEVELGYFILSELQSVKGPLGLPIERDLHFEPKSLRELRDKHKKDRGGH